MREHRHHGQAAGAQLYEAGKQLDLNVGARFAEWHALPHIPPNLQIPHETLHESQDQVLPAWVCKLLQQAGYDSPGIAPAGRMTSPSVQESLAGAARASTQVH